MTSSTLVLSPVESAASPRAGFTLVEMIVVLALLVMAAAFVAPRMDAFIRGRTLALEAERLRSLLDYAQSRAIDEGVPVLVWVNPTQRRYGSELQPGYAEDDNRAVQYELGDGMTLQVRTDTTATSELGDEMLGMGEGVSGVRFLPNGSIDFGSVSEIIVRQESVGAYDVALQANRLGYAIQSYHVD